MTDLNTDCRHFRSDRPCAPHKATGVVCATCEPAPAGAYDPVATRVLVVKLAAAGDVLRTTCFLPALHRRWPGAHVTWVTAPDALPLFAGNPLVDQVIPFRGGVPVELAARRFDVILNPDADPSACALAHAARGETRLGFDLDERTGLARPLGPGAARWFELGVRDDLKRANRTSYQQLVADVLQLDWRLEPPMLAVDEAAAERGRRLRAEHPPADGRLVIGLNTGAGRRWRFKRWTEDGMTELVRRLSAEGHRVFLLGGPDEIERNARLVHASGDQAVDTGTDNPLPVFAGIVDACDVVLTGDTLAMHVAIARGKRVVALFGPTPPWEIEFFGRGEAVASDVPCLVCYLPDCDVAPNCMESITPDMVQAALTRQVEALRA